MRDHDGERRVKASFQLAPADLEALRVEAARRVQAGERGFGVSRLVREAVRSQPWFRGGVAP